MTVHNQTGHQTVVFLLQNDAPDLDPDDGVQVAAIDNGGSAVAHVPHCHFGVLLVDHEDIWHAEFHDCHSADFTFTSSAGHAKRQHHHDHDQRLVSAASPGIMSGRLLTERKFCRAV